MSQQINLFSPIFLKKKKHFSALTMLQGLAAIAVGVLAFYAYADHEVSGLSAQAQSEEKRLKANQERLERFVSDYAGRGKNKELGDRIQAKTEKLQIAEQIVNTLKTGALGNTQGYSEYMRAFAREIVNGLWLTGFTVSGAGQEISVSGKTLSADLVPVYIRKLNQEKIMQGRQFSSLQLGQSRDDKSGKPGINAPTYLEFSLASDQSLLNAPASAPAPAPVNSAAPPPAAASGGRS